VSKTFLLFPEEADQQQCTNDLEIKKSFDFYKTIFRK